MNEWRDEIIDKYWELWRKFKIDNYGKGPSILLLTPPEYHELESCYVTSFYLN
jgi:hypothetical protein